MIDGKIKRKKMKGIGEDINNGLFKPEKYDIIVNLNDGFDLDQYYIQVLIEEFIEPITNLVINNGNITKGWVPIKVVFSDLAIRAKNNIITISDPKYDIIYDTSCILYEKSSFRIIVLSQHKKTKKIEYIVKEYPFPN